MGDLVEKMGLVEKSGKAKINFIVGDTDDSANRTHTLRAYFFV